jgi:hypothetical protein
VLCPICSTILMIPQFLIAPTPSKGTSLDLNKDIVNIEVSHGITAMLTSAGSCASAQGENCNTFWPLFPK